MADSGRARGAADSALRARDIDRAQVSTVLDAAYAEGQLGAHEYHDRADRARTAKTLGELRRLTADLQSPEALGARPVPRKPLGRKHPGEYPPHTRARDSDRAAIRTVLDAARADGQLDAEEHTALSGLAEDARTLGDLATLVAELQQRPAAPVKPRARRTARLVTVAAAALVAVAAFAWTVRDDNPPVPDPGITAEPVSMEPVVIPTPDLTTGAGFRQFRTDYLAKFGDTLVDEAVLHDEHASVDRRAPDKPTWTVDYTYRGGFDRSTSQLTTRARDAVDIDLALVDATALDTALREAATTVRVPDGKVTHLRIAKDSWTGGHPAITVFVRNELGEAGDFVLALSGELLSIDPYEG
ncbi:DUF1707 SHOCT-like domain-containing protein [Nocardia sp. SSK8]|uniref:DUF1707 SHOCT-like domain-containing protein n=1 Tax=Nocardia sp. SSK8 TaxID=3120154 RepID=UPI00300818C6